MEIIEVRCATRDWRGTDDAGLTYSLLRGNGRGGASYLLRFEAGAVGRSHSHPEGEELLVLEGDITVGDRRLTKGDYLYTPPGGVHKAVAHAETIIFVNAPKMPIYL